MPLVPAAFRCAVALGYGWDDEGARDYVLGLVSVAEEHGARLQFFVQGMTSEEPGHCLADLAARGHAIDQCTSDHAPLTDSDPAELLRTRELLGAHVPEGNLGLRASIMRRNGIQQHEDVQQLILDCGLEFLNSDYPTKSPENPGAIGFADKNAAMVIKHNQPRWYATGLLEIPSPGYSDRDFLDAQARPLDQWIAHVTQCIDFAHDMGGLLYAPALHVDTHSRHDPELRAIRAIFEHAASKREPVRFCTYREVHEWAVEMRAGRP